MQTAGSILGNPRNKDLEQIILDPRNPRKKGKTQNETDAIAEMLVQKYSAPQFRNFFLKTAWRLNESRIAAIVEASFAKNIGNPRAYFIGAVKNEKSYKE